jgi:hypothetical protein
VIQLIFAGRGHDREEQSKLDGIHRNPAEYAKGDIIDELQVRKTLFVG